MSFEYISSSLTSFCRSARLENDFRRGAPLTIVALQTPNVPRMFPGAFRKIPGDPERHPACEDETPFPRPFPSFPFSPRRSPSQRGALPNTAARRPSFRIDAIRSRGSSRHGSTWTAEGPRTAVRPPLLLARTSYRRRALPCRAWRHHALAPSPKISARRCDTGDAEQHVIVPAVRDSTPPLPSSFFFVFVRCPPGVRAASRVIHSRGFG